MANIILLAEWTAHFSFRRPRIGALGRGRAKRGRGRKRKIALVLATSNGLAKHATQCLCQFFHLIWDWTTHYPDAAARELGQRLVGFSLRFGSATSRQGRCLAIRHERTVGMVANGAQFGNHLESMFNSNIWIMGSLSTTKAATFTLFGRRCRQYLARMVAGLATHASQGSPIPPSAQKATSFEFQSRVTCPYRTVPDACP